MEFRGKDLRKTVARAVRGGKTNDASRRRECARIWVKLGDLEREVTRFNAEIQQLESTMQSIHIRQILTAAELLADVASVVSPLFRGASKLARLAVALRRVIRGGRMSHVIEELRDLIDLLSDINSALDNLNSLIQDNRELANLSARVRKLREVSRTLENKTSVLTREAERLDCDNLPEPDSEPEDEEFVGVGFGKKK